MRRKAIVCVQKQLGLSQKNCKFLTVAISTVWYIVNKSKDDLLLEVIKSVVAKYLQAVCQMIHPISSKTVLKINSKCVKRIFQVYKLRSEHRKTKK